MEAIPVAITSHMIFFVNVPLQNIEPCKFSLEESPFSTLLKRGLLFGKDVKENFLYLKAVPTPVADRLPKPILFL